MFMHADACRWLSFLFYSFEHPLGHPNRWALPLSCWHSPSWPHKVMLGIQAHVLHPRSCILITRKHTDPAHIYRCKHLSSFRNLYWTQEGCLWTTLFLCRNIRHILIKPFILIVIFKGSHSAVIFLFKLYCILLTAPLSPGCVETQAFFFFSICAVILLVAKVILTYESCQNHVSSSIYVLIPTLDFFPVFYSSPLHKSFPRELPVWQ